MKKVVIAMLIVVLGLQVTALFINSGHQELVALSESEDFDVTKISNHDIDSLNQLLSQQQDFCIFNCYVPVYTADGWEKNDTLNSSRNVGNAVPVGYTSLWNGTLHDVSATTSDVDYYKFSLNTKRQIKVELKNIPTGKNYNIKLYKVSGFFNNVYTQIGESNNSSNLDEVITTSSVQDPGDYIIQVYTISGLSSSPYTIYLSALYPMQSVAYKTYNLNLGKYEHNIVKFIPDYSASASAARHTLYYCYFIPYELLLDIYQFSIGSSPLSMVNNTLGLSNEEMLYDEVTAESIIGGLAALVIAKYAGPLGNIFTGILLINAILSYASNYIEKTEFYAAFNYAIANQKGMYYLYEGQVTSGDLLIYYTDYEFGSLINQQYAYNVFTMNISTSVYTDFVGTLTIERTIIK